MMNLKTLSTFRSACSTLNFSETAAQMGYVQSSVTAQIKSLEAHLDVKLFDRLGKGVALTEPGRRLLVYANQVLGLCEEATARLTSRDAIDGEVVVAGAETICTYRLPPVFRKFQTDYPQARLRFVPGSVRTIKRRLIERDLDVAFILEESFENSSLHCEQLSHEPVIIVASPGHPLSDKEHVYAQDLIKQPVLFTELGCNYRNRLERVLIQAGAHPGGGYEFGSIETIKACVAQGMGVAALPAVAVERELKEGKLAKLNWAEQSLDVSTQIAWSRSKWLSPAVEAFIALARAQTA